MKKILVSGMTNYIGGIETYIRNVFTYLCEDYQFYFPYVENIAYEDEIKALGGKFICDLPFSRKKPFDYYAKWNQAFREHQFDIVYYNDCDMVSIDVLSLAKKHKVPVRIFHAHNSSSTLERNFIYKLIERLNKKLAKRVITNRLACSKNAGDYMYDGLSYMVVKNGINTDKYCFSKETRQKKRMELGLKDKQKVILFVGRATTIKNPLFAIDVIKECHRLNPAYIGLICGGEIGSLSSEVKQKVINEKLANSVKLLGNRTDVNELYAAADYLIMPSLFEGFPFVLVEAQCSGLKCICSDKVETNTNLSGTVEYLPLEIEPAGWAEKIVTLPTDYNRDSGKAVIREAGFDIEQTVQVIEDIFEGKNTQ